MLLLFFSMFLERIGSVTIGVESASVTLGMASASVVVGNE